MSDPTGLSAGLGLESVEWSVQGDTLTVRVSGRWRRRRPTWSGSPMLVIEAEGRRQAFPATPEPPSLAGAAPGMWRMSFALPALLAPYLRGNLWLKLGVVLLPLPAAVESAALVESGAATTTEPPESPVPPESPEPPELPEPSEPSEPSEPVEQLEAPEQSEPARADLETLIERRLRSAELALESSRERLVEAEDEAVGLREEIEFLERELQAARREPRRLNQVLAERDRGRREAEQRAHAERALREELQEELAERERELRLTAAAREQLTSLQARVRELEEEVEQLRRRADEAEQEAAAAALARSRAERRVKLLGEQQVMAIRVPTGPSLSTALEPEFHLAKSRAAPPSPVPPPAATPFDRAALARERQLQAARDSAREAAETRALMLEAEVQVQADRVAGAYEAIAALRDVLEALRTARTAELSLPSSGPVDPDRLAAALMRLRTESLAESGELESEASPPQSLESGTHQESETASSASPAAKPWLHRAFKSLVERDPETAGALALALLPALRALHCPPTAFDLVLDADGTIRVTVTSEEVRVEQTESPRERTETRFVVRGELGSFARLLVVGRLRRRFGRRIATVQGDRRELSVLRSLVRAPLSIGQLVSSGVELDPSLALTVAAAMVRPEWTMDQRFVLAYQELGAPSPTLFLEVRDGEPLRVSSRAPFGDPDATVLCRAPHLLGVLGGVSGAQYELRGEDGKALTLLVGWVKRAQSGLSRS